MSYCDDCEKHNSGTKPCTTSKANPVDCVYELDDLLRQWKQSHVKLNKALADKDKPLEAFFRALNAPGRIRLRLIKWLWPELKTATQAVQDYYWR